MKLLRHPSHCSSPPVLQIPTTLGLELATNPFLRPSSQEIRRSLRVRADASDAEVFAAVRKKKDSF